MERDRGSKESKDPYKSTKILVAAGVIAAIVSVPIGVLFLIGAGYEYFHARKAKS